MRGVKLPEPVQPRAVAFSLGALCVYDRADETAGAASRQVVKRLAIRGDSSETFGLRGAELVGMRSVLLCGRSPRWWDQQGAEPEFVVSTLNEVATLVKLPAPAGGPRARRRVTMEPAVAGR